MKCPFCNENLPEGSMFCSNCGTRVDNASGSGGAKGGGVNEVPLYQIPEPAPAMMPERKKGGKGKWIAIGTVSAVAVAGCVAVAVFALTAKTPKEKVIAAFEQVYDSQKELPGEEIFGFSQFAEMAKSQDMEEGISLSLSDTSLWGTQSFVGSGFSLDAKFSPSRKQSSADVGFSYQGMKMLDAQVYYGDDRLMAAVPQLSSYAFLLDMSGDFGSKLKNSPMAGAVLQSQGVDGDALADLVNETLDRAYDTENPAFDLNALLNRYQEGCKAKDKFKEALTVEKEKGNKKSFPVDGKEKKCQGYSVVISKDAMIDFLEESSDFFLKDEILRDDFLNQLELMARFSQVMGESFTSDSPKKLLDDVYQDVEDRADELIRILDKTLDDVEMVVYLDRKGNLVAFSGETNLGADDDLIGVEFEVSLKGGSHPLQNLEAMAGLSNDGERITVNVEREGTFDKEALTDRISVEMNVVGDRVGGEYVMSYGRADGDLKMQLDIMAERLQVASISLEAVVDELEKGKSIHMDLEELRIEDSLNDQHMAFEGEFCLKPLEGEIEEPEGQVFDVLEADLSDWGAVGEEIEEKAEASFGDLF